MKPYLRDPAVTFILPRELPTPDGNQRIKVGKPGYKVCLEHFAAQLQEDPYKKMKHQQNIEKARINFNYDDYDMKAYIRLIQDILKT